MEVSEPVIENPSSGALPAENTEVAMVSEELPPAVAVENVDASYVAQDAAQSADYESKPAEGEEGPVASGENVASHEDAGLMPEHSVGYDAVNGGYQSTGTIENGIPSNEVAGPPAEQQYEDVNSAEEERLWSMVRANCLDFNAWTALIEETERVAENNILKIRRVYDAFLAEFPLCFGYWKKYADHEGRLDSVNKVVEVYERAVHAVTYSVDIWLHYCVFAISTYEDPDTIRSAIHIPGGKVCWGHTVDIPFLLCEPLF